MIQYKAMKQGRKRLASKSEPKRIYSVAEVATMSASESTLLNAMIGRAEQQCEISASLSALAVASYENSGVLP